MNLLINIIIYLSYLMDGYITCIYFSAMFEPRGKPALFRFVLYAVGFSLLFLVFLLDNSSVNLICNLLVMVVLGKLVCSVSWMKVLFHSTVMSMLLIACETLVIFLFNMFFDVNAESVNTPLVTVFVRITSKTLLFVVCKFICILSLKDRIIDKWMVLLFVVPVVSLLCMLIMFNQSTRLKLSFAENILTCISSTLLFASNLVVFNIYEYMLKKEQELTEMRISEQRRELDYERYGMLEENRKELRVVIHDIKHHLNLIRCMARENGDSDIANYIDSIQEAPYFDVPVLLSGNKIADTVISQKRVLCQKKGIEFTFEHNNTDLSFVSDFDLCAIVSNAMDNAIEAAEKSTDKFVKVSFYPSENNCFCFLEFINSCDEMPVSNRNGFVSSKKGKYHGVGLYSIRHTAQKYSGEMLAQYTEDKKFRTTVMLQRAAI